MYILQCRIKAARIIRALRFRLLRWLSGSGSIAEKSSISSLSHSNKFSNLFGCIRSSLWSTRLYLLWFRLYSAESIFQDVNSDFLNLMYPTYEIQGPFWKICLLSDLKVYGSFASMTECIRDVIVNSTDIPCMKSANKIYENPWVCSLTTLLSLKFESLLCSWSNMARDSTVWNIWILIQKEYRKSSIRSLPLIQVYSITGQKMQAKF